MADPARDLKYLKEGLAQLKDYLLSGELFWPMGGGGIGGTHVPKLTAGNLLLAQKRLAAEQLEPNQAQEFDALNAQLDELRQQWHSAWQKKVLQEFISRLRQWGHMLNDLERDKKGHAPYFDSEVRVRVLLELLKGTGVLEEQQLSQLTILDERLRRQFKPGGFVWEEELQSVFLEGQYWFLYGGVEEDED